MSKNDANSKSINSRAGGSIIGKKAITLWFFILVVLTFVLIIWGAMVRLTGSGMSIPEWPIINGSLLPPMAEGEWQEVFKTYYLDVHNITDMTGADVMPLSRFKVMFSIEYIHRSIAAIVGILFLVLLGLSLWNKSRKKLIGDLMMIALFLLIIQVLLGGIVVKEELKPQLVSAHLVAGYLFFALVFWAYLKLKLATVTGFKSEPNKNKLWLFSSIAVVALLMQILSGGLMAGSGAGHILNTYPKMGNVWIPSSSVMISDIYDGFWQNFTENRVLIQFIHRWWIIAVVLTVGLIHAFRSKTLDSKRLRLAFRGSGILVILQILVGIGNLMMKVPVYMSVIHSIVALLLYLCLTIMIFEARFERANPNP